MKVVIADASCLILFTNINRLDLLNKIFGELWITNEVLAEYNLALPSFASVHNPSNSAQCDQLMLTLDPGEATSIALALENPGCKLVIDEKEGGVSLFLSTLRSQERLVFCWKLRKKACYRSTGH